MSPGSPNALGQATQAGTYATGASYFPNGALKQFTYGNQIVHTLTQNIRGLPERSLDTYGANAVLDDTYDFDFNGNVAAISDGLAGAPGDRDMTYDALDRLVGAAAGAAQGGNAVYSYDPLDNLRVADQGARQYRYTYNASNRLANIKTPAGTTVFSFSHDGRGNQTARSGATFTWDRANRLAATSLGTSSYVYDGLGRRVQATAGGITTHSFYGHGGELFWQQTPTQKHAYVRLAGSLVAQLDYPAAGGAASVKYQHTDALGTPVAETDANRAVTRERMTAYGEPVDGTYSDGPGYTGHLTDAASKLTYMQQRYYDPVIGRFLSVDPITFLDNSDARHLSRYSYAFNNPAKFVDPDGRAPGGCGDGTCDSFFGNNPAARDFLNGYNSGIEDAAEGNYGASDFGSVARRIGYGAGEGVVDSVNRDPLEALPRRQTRTTPSTRSDFAEHTKNARGSTRGKHEKGQTRKKRDAGGERGDDRRRDQRKRPPGHQGPWPPKDK